MANFDVKIIGAGEFYRAMIKNPALVESETKKFITRALAKYKSGIINSPWSMSSSGGGSPVASVNGGNLRDTHLTEISNMEGRIFPSASYSTYVHGLDDKKFNVRGVRLRPWLDYVFNDKMKEVEELENNLVETIINGLAD